MVTKSREYDMRKLEFILLSLNDAIYEKHMNENQWKELDDEIRKLI